MVGGTSGYVRMRRTSVTTLPWISLIVSQSMNSPASEPGPRAAIVPALRINLCLLQALRQHVANNLIRKGLHATVGVMDHEPLACTEKLVADHKRANSIVACAAAGIPNHMRVAFGEADELCRIEARIHASQNRKAPRGRHGELTFSAEPFAVGAIGSQHLIKNSAHSWKVSGVKGGRHPGKSRKTRLPPFRCDQIGRAIGTGSKTGRWL